MSNRNLKHDYKLIISKMMEEVLLKTSQNPTNSVGQLISQDQLLTAIVPNLIFKCSKFDKMIGEFFEQILVDLAVVTANDRLGIGKPRHAIHGVVRTGKLARISETLNRLEHKPKNGEAQVRPNWEKELAYISKGRGEKIPVTVICDVYAENELTGERFAFELKAPLPNSDQTKVSKEKILKLYCMEPQHVDAAYYALPYNPYGRRQDYAWSFPARWFNMKEDDVVLIGNEFWEKIGGVGTYQAFIQAVNEIGPAYKERIYREYLGIEPPPEYNTPKLH